MPKVKETKKNKKGKKASKQKALKVKYEDMIKEEKIEYHVKRLKRQFSKLDSKTKNIVDSLIKNAAFMTVSLEILQDTINVNGMTVEYQNGANQWGTKKSPEAEMYNTMIKNLSTVTKQLSDLVPRNIGIEKTDDFDDFTKERYD